MIFRAPAPFPDKNGHPNGLTCIHRRIHCVATRDVNDNSENELDRIAIDNFLTTLAEVTLAVARRKEQLDQ